MSKVTSASNITPAPDRQQLPQGGAPRAPRSPALDLRAGHKVTHGVLGPGTQRRKATRPPSSAPPRAAHSRCRAAQSSACTSDPDHGGRSGKGTGRAAAAAAHHGSRAYSSILAPARARVPGTLDFRKLIPGAEVIPGEGGLLGGDWLVVSRRSQ